MKEYIKICDVEKYYGASNNITKAVDRVSFTVDKGEFLGIMGPSGSGKSTLLNMLSTIDHVTAGHIYFGDTDITELNEGGMGIRCESVFREYTRMLLVFPDSRIDKNRSDTLL